MFSLNSKMESSLFQGKDSPSGWLNRQHTNLPQRGKFAPVLGFALLFEEPCPLCLRGHSSSAILIASSDSKEDDE